MITITRAMARRFRAAAKKCLIGRPRAPDPPVLVWQTSQRITLTAEFPEVILELGDDASSSSGNAAVLLPMHVLDMVQGSNDDPVEIVPEGKNSGRIRWSDRGEAKHQPIEWRLPETDQATPHRPAKFPPISPRLLLALHECGRSAGREDGRFAISRIQIKGKTQHVIGTDGHIVVAFTDLAFPFTDDILVPAIPLFGFPELRGEEDVRVGRTVPHLVVEAGPWTAWLTIAADARYPDTLGLIARNAPTVVELDDTDAAVLLDRLPELPGDKDQYWEVTLDADQVLRVRARDSETGATKEITLSRSRSTGPVARFAVDRRLLSRLLALGCRTLRMNGEKPMTAEADGIRVVVAGLDPSLVVPPADKTNGKAPPSTESPTPRRSTVKPPETNGHVPSTRDSPAPPIPDALAEAEALRTVLAEALNRVTKLVAILKAGKKRERVLENVMTSLGQLRPGGPP